MNRILELKGADYPAEKVLLEKETGNDVWFVLDNAELTLDQYLTYLHDNLELGNTTLSRLRVCRNLTWEPGQVTVVDADGTTRSPADMIELLRDFPHGEREPDEYGERRPLASIVIESDERKLLANIAQQLIYLAYPLAEIELKLRSEFADAERVRRFQQRIDELAQTAGKALANIRKIEIPTESVDRANLEKQKENALQSYGVIQAKIAEARNVEMKVAVAASKKTGKSVLVNCLLGQELAPTSLEMATPNSCVYRRSPDDRYHLVWDKESPLYRADPDKFRDATFAEREELYRAVDAEFKKAQKDTENKFLIPDLIIEYPTNNNNFDAYTIHDTPGPDLAGSAHRESAQKAMDECDASIFAIDYGKYLTESETEYLGKVKSIFAGKNKFHTLIFAINKLDLSLQDGGAKSRVKSIDFIRNRLKAIDEKYADCIIFATSALDYFNTVTLEESAKEQEALQPLFEAEANWLDDFSGIKRKVRGKLPEAAWTAMSNLGTETDRLADLLGYEVVNLHEIREFSGMPQLMSYLKYILESKAREEIVNFIAVTIDAETGRISAILDQSPNLEALLKMNDEAIARIRAILEAYRDKVDAILDRKITPEDLESVDGASYFGNVVAAVKASGRELTFEALIEKAEERLRETQQGGNIPRELWNRFADAQIAYLQFLKARGILDRSRLALPEEHLASVLESFVTNTIVKIAGEEEKYLNEFVRGLMALLGNRFAKVRAAGEICRAELEKENCPLVLPDLPGFEPALSRPAQIAMNIGESRLKESVARAFAGKGQLNLLEEAAENFNEHGFEIWKYRAHNNLVNLASLSRSDIEGAVKNMHADFYEMIEKSGIEHQIRKLLQSIGKDSLAAQQKMLEDFYSLNRSCQATVAQFMSVIDDRARYEKDSEEKRAFLKILGEIQKASSDFIKVWREIRTPLPQGVAA